MEEKPSRFEAGLSDPQSSKEGPDDIIFVNSDILMKFTISNFAQMLTACLQRGYDHSNPFFF